jgi:hypothetical protein
MLVPKVVPSDGVEEAFAMSRVSRFAFRVFTVVTFVPMGALLVLGAGMVTGVARVDRVSEQVVGVSAGQFDASRSVEEHYCSLDVMSGRVIVSCQEAN